MFEVRSTGPRNLSSRTALFFVPVGVCHDTWFISFFGLTVTFGQWYPKEGYGRSPQAHREAWFLGASSSAENF